MKLSVNATLSSETLKPWRCEIVSQRNSIQI